MCVTREHAEKLVLPEFGMDPYFPPEGAECSVEHVEYMLRKIWPMRSTFEKVLVAQRAMATYTTIGIFAVGDNDLDHLGAGHVFLIDNPGKGKTLFAKVPTKIINGTFARIQGVPDMMPSDYTGNRIIDVDENGKKYFRLVKGPAFADIQLFDEINRMSARTQSALLEVLGEGTITIPGERTHAVRPFAIMTANPIESEGTSDMVKALLDRVMFQIRGDNFTADDFADILHRTREFQNVEIHPITNVEEVGHIRKFFFESMHIDDEIEHRIGYFAEVTNDPHRFGFLNDIAEEFGGESIVEAGLSGRGEIHILGAARTLAAFRYRNYVTPDDVRKVLLPTLRHRIFFRRGVLPTLRDVWKQKSTLDTADRIITRLINEAWK